MLLIPTDCSSHKFDPVRGRWVLQGEGEISSAPSSGWENQVLASLWGPYYKDKKGVNWRFFPGARHPTLIRLKIVSLPRDPGKPRDIGPIYNTYTNWEPLTKIMWKIKSINQVSNEKVDFIRQSVQKLKPHLPPSPLDLNTWNNCSKEAP